MKCESDDCTADVVQFARRDKTGTFLMWYDTLQSGCWKGFDKLLNSIGMTPPGEVVVYSRKGCHLCEIVKESLVKLHKRGGFTWREIDVDSDADIRRRYNDEVPVVFINGRKAFKYRMDEQEFLRKLSA